MFAGRVSALNVHAHRWHCGGVYDGSHVGSGDGSGERESETECTYCLCDSVKHASIGN